MKEQKKIKINMYIQMLLWICMGLALFILHDDAAGAYTTVLGLILLIQGFPQLILFIIERTRYLYSLLMLLSGFFTCIIGVVSIKVDDFNLLPIMIGMIILIHGGKEGLMMYYIKRQMFKNWRVLMALSYLTVAYALFLMILTLFYQNVSLLQVTGIAMIFDAIIEYAIFYIGDKREEIIIEKKLI